MKDLDELISILQKILSEIKAPQDNTNFRCLCITNKSSAMACILGASLRHIDKYTFKDYKASCGQPPPPQVLAKITDDDVKIRMLVLYGICYYITAMAPENEESLWMSALKFFVSSNPLKDKLCERIKYPDDKVFVEHILRAFSAFIDWVKDSDITKNLEGFNIHQDVYLRLTRLARDGECTNNDALASYLLKKNN